MPFDAKALVQELTSLWGPVEPEKPAPIAQKPANHSSRKSVIERAALYIETVEDAIQGQGKTGGSGPYYRVARILVWGFSLSIDEARPLIQAWNQAHSKPPFSDKETEHKLESALTRPHPKPYGYLIDAPIPPGRGAAHGGHGPENEDPEDDFRPIVRISTERHSTEEQAVRALATNSNVYVRSGMLFEVLSGVVSHRGIQSDENAPRMLPIPQAKLAIEVTRCAQWEKQVWDAEEEKWVGKSAHPPDWAVAGVMTRGHYEGVRFLEWITETPILRPDGTLLTTEGYDPQTAVVYLPCQDYGQYPEAPTREDARAAGLDLLDFVGEFPFVHNCHRGTWIANILSVLGRFAFQGPVPVFLYDASASRTGKTLLCDLVSAIATGRNVTTATYPENEEEFRKRMTAILMEGDRLVLIDNVPSHLAFGGQVMDAILTGKVWRDRILTMSKMCRVRINSVFMATGNNLTIQGDLLYRLVPCRICANVEEPHKRKFKIEYIDKFVYEHRARYVRDTLIILRAYCLAGRPKMTEFTLGGYEEWSDWIRSAIIWALDSSYDPVLGQSYFRADDPTVNQKKTVVYGLADLMGTSSPGMTAAEILETLAVDVRDHMGRHTDLHDAVMEWSFTDRLPSARALGRRLKAFKDEVVGDYRLTATIRDHASVWKIRLANGEERPPTNGDTSDWAPFDPASRAAF